MYKIENKKVTFEKDTGLFKVGANTRYKDLVETCNMVMPPGGWTPLNQKSSLRIDAALEKFKDADIIEIESSDFEYLKKAVENCPWSFKHSIIVDFADYIKDLKESK